MPSLEVADLEKITRILTALLELLRAIADAVLSAIGVLEGWLRALLRPAGVQHQVQTAILVALAVGLVFVVLRRLGGALRIVLAALLALLALHLLLPGLHA